ncbi:MAG: hypothetical protein SFX74_08915 [Fimbriimonadaceae bacterium]|nr:hypothetical protein [Fimbriimonadaceae bacterium]
MNYLVCIRISRFYTRTHEAMDGTLTDRPFIVTHQKRVLDANLLARQRGIMPGMGESEARAVAEDGYFLPYRDEDYRDAQRDWLDRCVPYSDVIQPLSPHRALVDLSDHPNPRDLAERMIYGIPGARAGAAPNRWLAESAAEETDDRQVFFDVTPCAAEYARRLPVERLRVISAPNRQRLRFLGYERLGDLAKVAVRTLRRQFGDDAEALRVALTGGGDCMVQAQYPPDHLRSTVRFEGVIQDWSIVDAGLHRLADDLGEQLRASDRCGRTLVLICEVEEGAPVPIRRTFTRPMTDAEGIFIALGLMASELPREGLTGLRASLPDVFSVPRIQRVLDRSLDRHDRERAIQDKAVAGAVSKVRAAFGDSQVALAAQVAEPRRKQVLRVWRDATGWA